MLEARPEERYFRQVRGRVIALFLAAVWVVYGTWGKY